MNTPQQPDHYQNGFDRGAENTRPDHYEGHLASQLYAQALTEQIQEKRDQITQRDTDIQHVGAARHAIVQQREPQARRVAWLSAQLTRIEADRKTIIAQQTDLQNRRKAAVTDYSLAAGLLFLVAGLSFLAGDLIISHEIVAYALNIRNEMEAWAFAGGLAMVSVLLKPAYDRLIEQPYQANKATHGPRYERFKLALALFAILTMGVLGWFRYEAYRTDQLKAAINKTIRQLQQSASISTDDLATEPTLTPAVLGQIEAQLQQSALLNQTLVSSPWALASFVLSGLLFALAGAVCLGLGIPVLTTYWFRWVQADGQLARLRKRLNRLAKQAAPLEADLQEPQTQQAIFDHELSLLPTLADLQAQRRQCATELANLLIEQRLTLTDSQIHLFNDGYSRGAATRPAPPTPEPKPSIKRNENTIATLADAPPTPATLTNAELLAMIGKNGVTRFVKPGVVK
jgi:hypothetical protein